MTILQMNLTASVLIIAIVVVRALALYHFPKKYFLVLWGVVVLRLLVPLSIPLHLPEDKLPETIPASPVVEFHEPATIPLPNVPTVEISPPVPEPFEFPYGAVWLFGVCAVATFYLYSYVKCRKGFKLSVPCENNTVKHIIEGLPLRRKIQVRQSEKITAPLTYGVFRPVILVPANMDMGDQDQLCFILTHEYIHIRRFDALAKLMLTIAVCIHWFNPLVWVMYELANRDIELSCDEEVLRRLGGARKKQYAMTLLHLEETRSRIAAPLTSYFGKHAMKERITAMANMKKYTKPMVVLAAIVALSVCVTAAFTVSSDDKAEQSHNSGRQTLNEEAANDTGSAKPDTGAEGENNGTAMGIIGSEVYDYPVAQPDDDAMARLLGTETDSDVSEYAEDPAPLQNGEIVSESGKKVLYENAVRGDSALILARGGALLPDSDPGSYAQIDDVWYKLYQDRTGILRKEYEVGNQDALRDSAKELMDELENGVYPVNSNGESYGDIRLSSYVGYDPVLSPAVGTNGKLGYIRESEVNAIERLPAAECPHEYQVNLYDTDGTTVLGKFPVSCGGHLTEIPGMTIEEAKNIIAEGSADTPNAPSPSVEQTSLVNGDFPRNSHGETYGNGLMAQELGREPELLAAIGSDGQEGYVRTSDTAHPNFQTSQEAFEWQLSQPASYSIPLYDFEGNEIGSFLIERSSLTVAEMEAMKAARDEG